MKLKQCTRCQGRPEYEFDIDSQGRQMVRLKCKCGRHTMWHQEMYQPIPPWNKLARKVGKA